jgi:hypothetical protein
MKFLVQCVFATSLFCAVAAVSYTTYTDASCATAVAATSAAPNPIVVGLNSCVKIAGTNPIEYQKIHACADPGKVAGALYSDSSCSTKQADSDFDYDVGKCIAIRGGTSQKLTCAPASSLSVAFLAVFASMLAVCMF